MNKGTDDTRAVGKAAPELLSLVGVAAEPLSLGRAWRTDRGALYAMLGRLFTMGASFALTAVAAAVLTPTEQGYFFIFLNLLLLQTFIELGLGAVLVQFVAHEWAHLSIAADGSIRGPENTQGRLKSLIDLSRKWYLAVGLTFIAVVGTGGYVFLSAGEAAGVDWVLPWWTLVLAQAVYLQVVPINGLLEGCDRVAANQRGLLLGGVAGAVVGLGALLLGAALYALPAMVVTRAIVTQTALRRAAGDVLAIRRTAPSGARVRWRREIWPLQWRIGLSWMAGFAMFQSFVPIAFLIEGPVVAGQVGIAVQALFAVQALGMAWVLAAQPRLGALAARGRLDELRGTARRTLVYSLATASVAALALLAILAAAYAVDATYAARFGDVLPLVVFLACGVLLQISNVETAAVRFRKREPFMKASFVGAGLVVLSNGTLGAALGVLGMAIGFASVLIFVLLPWIHAIFRRHMQPQGATVALEG